MKTKLIKRIWKTILVYVTPEHMPTKKFAKSCRKIQKKPTYTV